MSEFSIPQSSIQTWERAIYDLTAKRFSYLSTLPAIDYYSMEGGAAKNFVRAGSLSLNEAKGRNPKETPEEQLYDSRQLSLKRYHKEIILDKKDLREMVHSPVEEITARLVDAVNVKKDEVIATAALADVITGNPTVGPIRNLTFEQDGGFVQDATSGFTYSSLTEYITTFMNNYVVEQGSIANSGCSLLISGTEYESLLNEEKFINSLYIGNGQDVSKNGAIIKALGMDITILGGSKTGKYKIENPVLKENGTTRDCLLLAPHSIAFSFNGLKFDYKVGKDNYVESDQIKIVVEMGAMRLEGKKVMKIQTTF